jgi:hypothetical protein
MLSVAQPVATTTPAQRDISEIRNIASVLHLSAIGPRMTNRPGQQRIYRLCRPARFDGFAGLYET